MIFPGIGAFIMRASMPSARATHNGYPRLVSSLGPGRSAPEVVGGEGLQGGKRRGCVILGLVPRIQRSARSFRDVVATVVTLAPLLQLVEAWVLGLKPRMTLGGHGFAISRAEAPRDGG